MITEQFNFMFFVIFGFFILFFFFFNEQPRYTTQNASTHEYSLLLESDIEAILSY